MKPSLIEKYNFLPISHMHHAMSLFWLQLSDVVLASHQRDATCYLATNSKILETVR